MNKSIFKVLFLSLGLIGINTTSLEAADATRWINGKKYIQHEVAANETLYRLTVNYKVSQDDIKKANPQMKNGLQKGMKVLIPVKENTESAAKTSTNTKAASTAKPKVSIVDYKVKDGETLYSIAKANNTTVDDIKKRNASILKAGLKKGSTLKVAKNSAGNTAEIKAEAAEKKTASATKPVSSSQSGLTVHEVKKGETLYSISKEYNVKPSDIQRLNPSVKKSGVKAGKALIMPSTSKYIAKKESNPNYRIHKVDKKETVFSISKKYKVNSADLIAKNDLKTKSVKEGQLLALPTNTKTKTGVASAYKKPQKATTKSANVAHTVKKGETMFSLCKTYKISEKDLIAANPELKKGLKTGKIVFIPRTNAQKSAWGGSYFVSTNGNNHVKAAIVLPFESNGDKIDKTTDKFLEFYQGALLAIERLKEEGTSVELYTYNSGKTEADMESLLNKGELNDVNIIIGPAYKAQFKLLSEFALKHDIKVIIPFSSRTEEVKANPNVFLINTPKPQLASITATKLSKIFKDKNVVIVKFAAEAYNDEELLGDSIRHRLAQKGISCKEVTFSNTNNLKTEIDEKGENVLIPVTTDKRALADFLPSANSLAVKNKIEIFGFHDWEKYESTSKDILVVNTYMASPFDIDYNSWGFKNFIKGFRKYYNEEPGNTQPMYGAMGYDIMMYFGKAVAKHGRNFEGNLSDVDYNGVQSDFNFKQVNSSSYFYNSSVVVTENNDQDGHKVVNE